MLVPIGAAVKSPDRIRDRVTGKFREVDASIRYMVGSVPILVTIECRDRKNKQDVSWLEQVRAKRESIGAAQTIVVSRSGFTPEALRYAQAHGLIVRSIHETDDELVSRCLRGLKVAYHRVGWKDITVNVGFFAEEGDEQLRGKLSLASVVEADMLAGLPFAFDADGGRITLEKLFRECFQLEDNRIRSLVSDLGEVRLALNAKVDRGTLRTETELGGRFISELIFQATFFDDVTPLPELIPIEYMNETGEKIISFSHTHDPVSGAGVTIQFDWDEDGRPLTDA